MFGETQDFKRKFQLPRMQGGPHRGEVQQGGLYQYNGLGLGHLLVSGKSFQLRSSK